MNIIESLHWRYAVKQFSTDVINDGKVQELLMATRLSASSFGLQPYRLLLVKSAEIRQQLLAYSLGQDKVVNASHFIVFATQTNLGDEIVHAYIDQVSKVRGIPLEELQDLVDQIKISLVAKTPQQKNAWAKNQAYLALGNLLTCAAMMEIDACPMEGFNIEGYDKVLGLADKGLTTAVICPIGKRHEDDPFANMVKVRFDAEEMVLTF